jgi:ABC-type lipoprotein export system ATPase subunit
MSAILQLCDVSKSYDSVVDAPPVRVLEGINLTIQPGETLAVVGPSGCGKSTLLNIMGALDRPTSGRVLFQEQVLSSLDELQLADFRSRKIGFIFQAHHLLPQCTVLENVLVPTLAFPDRADRKGAAERARRLLDRVGLAARMDHRPGQLSGGERQRVAVVRALINQPQLLLADEPTGALDGKASDNLGRLLIELNAEEQVTLVVVTHSLELAARMKRRCDLVDGRLAVKEAQG